MFKKGLLLLIIATAIFLLDFSLFNIIKSRYISLADVVYANLFLFLLTILFFTIYNWLKKRKTKSPFTFLSLSFLKMILSLIFLFPVIFNNSDYSPSYIMHFFSLYFLYLFVEIIFLIKFSK
jgi:hypothetical protein